MNDPKTFRSAFNGFNREDVVHYIDYLNTQHSNQINQLNSQLELLRSRQEAAASDDADDSLVGQQAARIRELFDRCSALEQERDALLKSASLQANSEEMESLRAENALLREKVAAMQQELTPSKTEDELQAYRRAERVERIAQERTQQMYRQANAALSDATVRVDAAAEQITALSDRVIAQLEDLRNAVCSSKDALRDAAATMYAIRPNENTLLARAYTSVYAFFLWRIYENHKAGLLRQIPLSGGKLPRQLLQRMGYPGGCCLRGALPQSPWRTGR